MAIRAVVFDIGGVLQITPSLGVIGKWEGRLGLAHGQLVDKLGDVMAAGEIGAMTEEQVHRRVAAILGLDSAQLDAFMADIWAEYLGALNTGLAAYATGLRPRYRTALLSNSFVGARRKEQECYGFSDLTDLIIYSHEVGLAKPDPRIYELTCDRLQVRAEETVFVDDLPVNVEAAREIGLQTVLYVGNAQAIADINALISA